MINKISVASLFFLILAMNQSARHALTQEIVPPGANKIPYVLKTHNIERVDEYYWLNDRENPAVIDYLNRENKYASAVMADTTDLQKKLFDEIVGRIKQDDHTVPYEDRGYRYYRRFDTGKQYPIFCRTIDAPNADEEVLLDVNELALGKSFCQVPAVEVSPDNSLLAFAVDFVGRRQFTIVFKDLNSKTMLPDQITGANGAIEWANDNRTVFYTLNDPLTLRSYLIKRHVLGTATAEDQTVFEEQNEEFTCRISKSRSRQFIFIESSQTLSSEFRLLSTNDPSGEFVVFLQREQNHEYSIDHLDGQFTIRSNQDAPNFRLFTAAERDHSRAAWVEVIPHRNDTFLESFDLFQDFLVLTERKQAQTQLRVIGPQDGVDYLLPFDESAYLVNAQPTPNPETPWLRYQYTSMTTPIRTCEFNLRTRENRLLKQEPVLGGFDRGNYRTERVWATARDGTKIPVSIVYRSDTPLDGSAPCLQYAYGSYGHPMDPEFQSATLSLLDRGFVYALAHIRGGQEMGRAWYENGKLLNKINTFTDFIDVGKFLIESKYASRERLYAQGGSAGGLLIGAVVNMAPEQYHAVIADVPFVDVVTTMLDDSIPLTTSEYDEWGNPNEKESFDYMLSYSPYDNVVDRAYPNMLVTTGLHDSQVQYWEPAKWVAKLRDHWQGDNLLLLKTNMDAGHGGASGRFDRYKLVALRYAFLLKLAGLGQK